MSEKFKYTYEDLTKKGYIRIKLSKQEHNQIFGEFDNFSKYEYYENKDTIIFHRYTKIWFKILNVLLYPILLLINGIVNFKELNKEISDLFHEKEKGKFHTGHRWKNNLKEKGISTLYTRYLKEK